MISTLNARGAQDLASKMKPQATPLQRSNGAYKIFLGTPSNFDNSSMKTSPYQSPSKALGFGIML